MATISLFASFVLSNLSEAREQARDAVRGSALRNVATALELYRNDHGVYPSTGDEIGYYEDAYAPTDCNLTVKLKTDDRVPGLASGGYISSLPLDPAPPENVCFLYSSDGEYYIVSWDPRPKTANRLTPEGNPLYSLVGYRELGWMQYCLYNHPNLNGNPGHPLLNYHNFYAESFTITNMPLDHTPTLLS